MKEKTNEHKPENIKSINEELNSLKKRKSELKKQMEYSKKENTRRERAKRLIQTGALCENYFELHGLSIEEREELFKIFSDFIISNKPIKFKNRNTNNLQ